MTNVITIDDLVSLNSEILAIARARVPVAPELVTAAREMPSGASLAAQSIAAELEKGSTLDQAIIAQGQRLPAFYTAVVRAGLKSGNLTAALEGLSDSLARMRVLRGRVLGAFAYPLAVVAAAWMLLVIAAQHLGPQFDWVGLANRPAIASLVESGWRFWLLLFSVPSVLLVGAFFCWLRSRRPGRSFATGVAVADRLPVVGRSAG